MLLLMYVSMQHERKHTTQSVLNLANTHPYRGLLMLMLSK